MATQATESGTAVARRVDVNTPAGFRQQLRQNADKITLPQGISLEAFENVIFSATVQNPDLLKADRQSLILACLKAAQDGLLPNGRDAALVTFNSNVKEGGQWVSKKLVQYMPMVAGLRSKIWRAVNPKDGERIVTSLTVGVAYKVEVEKGYFVWERGATPEVQHRPMLDITEEEAADENLYVAYSIAKFADGTESVEVMRRFEINKVRQMSQTGAVGKLGKFGDMKGKVIPPKGPWVDWEPEMWKKTVLRRHSKVLPMAGDIVTFESNDEAADFKAADNTAAMLGSQTPDAPTLIEDQGGDDAGGEGGDDSLPPHDKETAELIEEKAEPEKAAKATKKKAEPAADASAGGNGSGGPAESAATTPAAAKSDASAPSGTNGADSDEAPAAAEAAAEPEAAAAEEPEATHENGVTKSPADVKAEELLLAITRSENVIDLERQKRELDKHRGALDAEHLTLLDEAYERRSAVLYGAAPAK